MNKEHIDIYTTKNKYHILNQVKIIEAFLLKKKVERKNAGHRKFFLKPKRFLESYGFLKTIITVESIFTFNNPIKNICAYATDQRNFHEKKH